MDAGELALVLTAIFTAIAASAACTAVWQTRSMQRVQFLPSLHLGGAKHAPDDRLTFTVMNGGGGPAKWVEVVFAQGMQYGHFLHFESYLAPGDRRQVTGVFEGQGASPRAVLVCRDLYERQHAWSFEGRHKTWTRSKRFGRRWYHRLLAPDLYPDIAAVFARFYPDAQLARLTEVPLAANVD